MHHQSRKTKYFLTVSRIANDRGWKKKANRIQIDAKEDPTFRSCKINSTASLGLFLSAALTLATAWGIAWIQQKQMDAISLHTVRKSLKESNLTLFLGKKEILLKEKFELKFVSFIKQILDIKRSHYQEK